MVLFYLKREYFKIFPDQIMYKINESKYLKYSGDNKSVFN